MQVLGFEQDIGLLAQLDPLGRELQDAQLPAAHRRQTAQRHGLLLSAQIPSDRAVALAKSMDAARLREAVDALSAEGVRSAIAALPVSQLRKALEASAIEQMRNAAASLPGAQIRKAITSLPFEQLRRTLEELPQTQLRSMHYLLPR